MVEGTREEGDEEEYIVSSRMKYDSTLVIGICHLQ